MQIWAKRTLRRVRRAINQPFDELNRWQRAIRFAYDLGRFGARQLKFDRAPQMAGALAFRTLFGLLPVLVVAMVLVKAMGMTDSLEGPLSQLCRDVGLHEINVNMLSDATVDSSERSQSQALDQWILDRVRQAQRIDTKAIGWVGFLVMIYAAIGLMVTIEGSFNTIYRAPEGRPWLRRVTLYWFILTFSPVVVILSTYLNDQVKDRLLSVQVWAWVSVSAGAIWSFLIVWLFMFIVYRLFPNSTVAVKPALAGAFVAALLLEIGKISLGAYLKNALSVSQLYGSLGLVPLFMFWVYLMWLIVLFGLEVAATLQMLRGRQLAEIEKRRSTIGAIDSASVLALMEIVAERFKTGTATSVQELADTTSIPNTTISHVLERLVAAGLLHRIADSEESVSLARSPNQISADEVINIGFQMSDDTIGGRRSVLTDQLRRVQQELTSRSTLASLIPSS